MFVKIKCICTKQFRKSMKVPLAFNADTNSLFEKLHLCYKHVSIINI